MSQTPSGLKWQTILNPFLKKITKQSVSTVNEVITGRVSGRSTDITEIVISGQGAIILTGAPHIGKSTLIHYLQRRPGNWSWRDELAGLRNQLQLDEIHFMEVDLTPSESIENTKKLLDFFVRQCIAALQPLYQEGGQIDSTDPKELRKLVRKLSNKNAQARYFMMFDTIERLEEPGMQLINLFGIKSHAQTAQERGIALLDRCGAIRLLVDLLDEFSNLGVILSLQSLPRPKLVDQFTHVSADLARFTTRTLQIFAQADAIGLLAQEPEDFGTAWASAFRSAGGNSIFSKTEREWLLEQAGTHPYVLQQFCLDTFHHKQKYAIIHGSWPKLEDGDKTQVTEQINRNLSTFVKTIWTRLQEALDKGSQITRKTFCEFISSSAGKYVYDKIDAKEWEALGSELRYILYSEGIVRYDLFQPIYYPGVTLCDYLIQKIEEESKKSTSSAVLPSSPPGRSLWLSIVRPGNQRERLSLSELEHRLLKALLQQPKSCTETELMKAAWGKLIERSVFTQRMYQLRKKLREHSGGIEIIENHYGGLYSLNNPEWLQLD